MDLFEHNKSFPHRLFFIICLISTTLGFSQKKENSFNLGGLLFGDIYHISQHHLEDDIGKTEAVLRRAYITFDAKIKDKWFARVRTETNQDGDFGVYNYETDVKDLFVGYTNGLHKIILGLSPNKIIILMYMQTMNVCQEKKIEAPIKSSLVTNLSI